MADRPLVLILSSDELLRELLSERFKQDHVDVREAATLDGAAAIAGAETLSVVVIDAISECALATRLLDDPFAVFSDHQPPLLLLAGSATPEAIHGHGWLDRVVGVPLSSDAIVEAALYCSTGRARREMKSGIRMRSAVTETFKKKLGTL